MSKIQEALKRLQSTDGNRVKKKTPGRRLPSSIIPKASKKKVEFAGEKHHLDEDNLVKRGLLAPLDSALPVADEFRRIKRPLVANYSKNTFAPGEHANLIMIASALPGAGKTFCSVNLAASISLERELSVLLVDADVAKPHISDAFGLGSEPGLIDLLVDDELSPSDVLVRTDMNDMQVIPAGRKHPQATELLASERMVDVMNELSLRYDDRIIIMDSPPMLITSEAQAIADHAGQIVLIIECGKTTSEEISDTLELIDSDKATNVVLNKSVYTQRAGYYGGGYGYGYNGFNEPEQQ